MKGEKLSTADSKGILSKGRLIDKIINKTQNYYGMDIRQNTTSSQNNDKEKALYSMKKKPVLETLLHCIYICLTTKRDMHFVLGNPIVGVNIDR